MDAEDAERGIGIPARVAHDLKNPLATIHGHAATLLEQDLPEETRTWLLQTIATEALRLQEMIDELRTS